MYQLDRKLHIIKQMVTVTTKILKILGLVFFANPEPKLDDSEAEAGFMTGQPTPQSTPARNNKVLLRAY